MTCQDCSGQLSLIAGGTIVSLFRCTKCGAQLMLPGDAPPPARAPTAPALAQGSSAPAPPRVQARGRVEAPARRGTRGYVALVAAILLVLLVVILAIIVAARR